ncbi:MAG: radical SAM protein [Chitinispirillaceae bacterium]|nr:radical SAM protein [Chitinispirillaceae bacterium]
MNSASYVYLTEEQWKNLIAHFDLIATSCTLCPRNCHVNRLKGERGFCGAPGELYISSIFPHHGEEPPISGENGSGTIFFSFCTLKCCFCQNYQISHEAEGRSYTPEELAEKMLNLQRVGCHNINLVTPTHFLPWILRALKIATEKGLTIPIVYNCGGYEVPSIISMLSNIVDIYLPDIKYGSDKSALSFSRASNYTTFCIASIREMFRQKGPLMTDDNGIAKKGLCIRHLILPNNLAESELVVDFLKSTFDPADIFISLMAQYRPLYRAKEFSEINRMITLEEYERVKKLFFEAGFPGFYQEYEALDTAFVIDFKKRKEERLKPY